MSRRCERSWEVDALRDGRLSTTDADSFARHCASCLQCRDLRADYDRLVTLARRLPYRAVDELHARRLRLKVLHLAATHGTRQPRHWPGWLAATVLASLIGLGAWSFSRSPRTVTESPSPIAARAPFGARIDASSGSAWSTAVEGRTERVILDDGALTLTVRHREPGERFLVRLPDGEIEVRGTTFHVEVLQRQTRSVQVTEGLVALRLVGSPERLLASNEAWSARPPVPVESDTTTTTAPTRRPAPPATRGATVPAARLAPPGATQKGISTEYAAAVSLFEHDRPDDAARALHAFVQDHQTAPEAEDAAFLEATALVRAGRGDAAGAVAERFLERFPRSVHVSEAATLAVRAARDRGDCVQARTIAHRWLASSKTRASVLRSCVGE